MLQFFRGFMKSKVGVVVTLAFLALIAFAFASSDVASTGTFGGIAGGDQVAVVGDRRVSVSELSSAASNAFEQTRQSNPTLTMQAFVAQGGLTQTLNDLISRTVLAEFGRQNGLGAGKRLIDSELAQIPAFQGPDGRFSRDSFNALLAQRQLTEAAVRDDFATNLIARQLLTPVAAGPVVPRSFASRYASLLRERRTGSIGLLPSALFEPTAGPSDQQLQAYYTQVRNRFIRPERRVIRYATFGEEALGTLPAPTEAQIAQRFQRDRAKYAAVENRTLTQLVVPTQAAANAIVAEVRGGKSLAAAAQDKGLRTVQVGPVTRQSLTTSASATVAQAAFQAEEGSLITPVRGGLGWYVLRVDNIDRQPARTLGQVRGEISTALATEQRAAALADMTSRIEEEFDSGKNLADVARELKLTLARTPPTRADGRIYGSETATVPAVLGPVLATAFEMEEGEPQIAPAAASGRFVVFDVPEITASAVAPLGDIRADVTAMWRRGQGARSARAAADAVLARVAKGEPLATALRAVKPNAPAPQQLDMNREALARQGRVPPEMALFFSMAEGTTKRLEVSNDGGWFVVDLDNVEAGQVGPNDPIVAATLGQLSQVAGEEYLDQFVRAAEKEVGVERNANALAALEAQLSGRANN